MDHRLFGQFGFARLFLRKTGGLPWMSVKEQELSDLTASILATFPRISNMFLHFRQVVDSTLQKGRLLRRKLLELVFN